MVDGKFLYRPKAANHLPTVGYDDVEIVVYESRDKTVRQIDHMSDRAIIRVYRAVTGDEQTVLNIHPVRRVVMGQLDIDWHEIHGIGVSENMSSNQSKRVVNAKKNAANPESVDGDTTATGPKAPRKSVKNLITSMLLDAQDTATIIERLRSEFPDKKAAENPEQHISYYRSILYREGKLTKPVRTAKAKAVAEPEQVAVEA